VGTHCRKDDYNYFQEPVDELLVPQYYKIVTHPMWFGRMQEKVDQLAYSGITPFEVLRQIHFGKRAHHGSRAAGGY